jgi:hypothetical protein
MSKNLTSIHKTKIGAIFLIVLGAYFLLKNLNIIPEGWDIGVLWPLLLIVPGILLLSGKDARDHERPGRG